MAESDSEWHPLFTPKDEELDEDATPPNIQEIIVQRKENGKLLTAPRTFLPSELPSLAALYAEYGGGEYYLLARNHQKRLVGRAIHAMGGPSKPLFDEGPVAAPKPVAQPANPMMAMMGGGEGGTMGIVMMMMQQMMQAQTQAAANQSQMMMAFIQSMASGNQSQIAAAQENMNRQAERDARDKESQMAMLIKLTEARQSGNSTGGEESFFKGVEFMRHFATEKVENAMKLAQGSGKGDFDLEGLLGTVMEAFQGFKAFQDMSGSGGVQVGPDATQVVS